jgi:hypothetical protein
MSAAVDKFAVEKLKNSNRYSRYDYNSGMQRGYLCMMISTKCGGEKQKIEEEDEAEKEE